MLDIWQYTSKLWGDHKANRYTHDLTRFMHALLDNKQLWKHDKTTESKNIFYAKYKKHFVFFKDHPKHLLILSVLHESMDLPNRLLEDIQ